MSFGDTTVTFVARTATGSAGRLGTKAKNPLSVDAPGCRHRPLRASEKPEWLTNVSTQVWKTTVPIGEYAPVVVDTIMAAAKANSVIRVDGVEYQIVGGGQPFDDMSALFKLTVLSQVQEA